MPRDLQKARDIFLHAVGKLPPEAWDDYVRQACGADAELERQARHLLKVHLEAGSFLSQPVAPPKAVGDMPRLATSVGDKETWERINPFIHGFEEAWRSGTPP